MTETMPKMIAGPQNLLYQQICAELAPEYINPATESHPTYSIDELGETPVFTPVFVSKFNGMLAAHGLHVSGTTHGWALMENCPACPCGEYENRWHYMCSC